MMDSFMESFDESFGFRTINDHWTGHVVKSDVDGYPAVWVRIIFDDEQQREEFLKELPTTDNADVEVGSI